MAAWDAAVNAWVPVPIDMGPPTDQLFLTLYGTGIRHRSGQTKVTATINGMVVPVLYADLQPSYPGLDQVNLQMPRDLAGSGIATLVVTVEDQASNTVTIAIR